MPGKVVTRQPIDVLQKSYPDVFNMLILAFQGIQARNESLDISWYQISGELYPTILVLDGGRSTHHGPRHSRIPIHPVAIHGRPYGEPGFGLLHPLEFHLHHLASTISPVDRGSTTMCSPCCKLTYLIVGGTATGPSGSRGNCEEVQRFCCEEVSSRRRASANAVSPPKSSSNPSKGAYMMRNQLADRVQLLGLGVLRYAIAYP